MEGYFSARHELYRAHTHDYYFASGGWDEAQVETAATVWRGLGGS